MADLFETPEKLPKRVRKIIEGCTEDNTYENCEKLLKAVKKHGYTFSYYLDAIPYNLRKIKGAKVLAVEFAKELKKELKKNLFAEMIEEHITDKAVNEPYCVSHDYCDANECMADAFKKLYGKTFSVQNQRQCDVFNKAWRIAKQNNFSLTLKN